MCRYQKILLVAALIFIFICYGSGTAEIVVIPFGFTVSVEEEGEAEVELVLNNSGEEDVAFSIDYELLEDEEDRRAGPRRDDPGDILAEYDAPCATRCLAWDENDGWMWGLEYDRLWAFDPENEEIVVSRGLNTYKGLFYLEGVLFTGGWDNNPWTIYRFDTECNALETWDSPINLNHNFIGSDDVHLFTYQRQSGEIHVFNLDDLEEVAVIDYSELLDNPDEVWDFEWVNAHPDGQLWLGGDGIATQCYVDEDWNCELVQEFEMPGDVDCAIGHDGENMWRGMRLENRWYVIDDGVIEFSMLTANPETGVIPGDDSETVEIHVITEGCEAGVYNILIEIELFEPEEERDDFKETTILFSAVISVDCPTAEITGNVTDEATGDLVAGARIETDRYIIARFTDDDGDYALPNLPPGQYELTFTAQDYLPTIENVNLENEDIALDVSLLHSECTPSDSVFFTELNPDWEQSFDFTITNGGNGHLTFTTEKRLPGDVDTDSWQLRQIRDFEEATGDNMLNGVTYTYFYFVISGGNNGQQISMIYVFDFEGNPVREFEQFHESRYGMRDLTWDGILVWGADEGVLYGFTVDGELEEEIEGEAESYRSITWDPDRQVFWSADITSHIFATNRNGELVRTIRRPDDVRMYGLAYWHEDPDGYQLYVFGRGDSTDFSVSKINLDNGEAMLAAELEVEGDASPGGISITSHYDVYSWVLVGMVQSPDRVAVWQLEARREWFDIDPVEGVIEAGDRDDFTMTLNSAGLPTDVIFEGEVVIDHDGVGGETILSVELAISEGGITLRILDLNLGWNMVSLNIRPDEEDVEVLMAPLVEEGLLDMMKDGAGHFYLPAEGFNNIPGWHVEQGYQIKMRGAAELRFIGTSVSAHHPIDLTEGWQLISYYPRFPIEARQALSRIAEYLVIAKDGFGNFYIPAWNFSNMGDMREGCGYYLNVSEDCQLIYTFERLASLSEDGKRYGSVYDQPGRLPVHAVTGENMSLLVLESPPLNPPLLCRGGINGNTPPLRSRGGVKGGVNNSNPLLRSRRGTKGGVEVGISTSGKLVGSGILQNGACGIAVWGDDPSTDEIDGAMEGDRLEIRLLTGNGLHAVDYEVLAGEAVYRTDGLLVIRLTDVAQVPEDFAIISAYPNPFNSVLRISYGLVEAGDVSLNVFDLSGRHVAELVNGRRTSGFHTAIFDGTHLASGVYLVRFDAAGHTSQMKVVMVR